MSKLIYVGLPAFTSLLLFWALLVCFRHMRPQSWQAIWSLRLALAQILLACLSVYFTTKNPISAAACETAIFGFMTSAAFAAVDMLNLLWWLTRLVRAREPITLPLAFVVLRSLAHAALIFSLLWCAQLCTV